MVPRPGYRLSPVLRLVQSRISSVNRLCNFIPAAPNSVRIASAVRPCRPITLPKSSGWVFNSRTVTWEPSTALTCTPSGWSTSALAISAKRSFIASSLRDKLFVGEAMIQAHFLHRANWTRSPKYQPDQHRQNRSGIKSKATRTVQGCWLIHGIKPCSPHLTVRSWNSTPRQKRSPAFGTQ